MSISRSRNRKGFTLIELIAVIVILGILAAVAVPKYLDMSASAEKAAANGIYAACQSVLTMNYAAYKIGVSTTSDATDDVALISGMAGIVDELNPAPTSSGWSVTGEVLSKTVGTTTYSITFAPSSETGEMGTLTKAGF